jgi:hypothetical protein
MITLELKEKNAHHRWENKQHHLTKSGTFRSTARKKTTFTFRATDADFVVVKRLGITTLCRAAIMG